MLYLYLDAIYKFCRVQFLCRVRTSTLCLSHLFRSPELASLFGLKTSQELPVKFSRWSKCFPERRCYLFPYSRLTFRKILQVRALARFSSTAAVHVLRFLPTAQSYSAFSRLLDVGFVPNTFYRVTLVAFLIVTGSKFAPSLVC